MTCSQTANWLSWALRLIVAAILLQTLFFKFTGAAESVYIFSRLGLEPAGRIGSGLAELLAASLLLLPARVPYGALLSLAVISGALVSHFTRLGIVVINSDGTSDGGLLFGLALAVFFGSLGILWLHRAELPWLGAKRVNPLIIKRLSADE